MAGAKAGPVGAAAAQGAAQEAGAALGARPAPADEKPARAGRLRARQPAHAGAIDPPALEAAAVGICRVISSACGNAGGMAAVASREAV